jgi:hypothetical protein
MAVSFVNGYLCTSCCDVAKAKRGENPHPKPGETAAQAGEASRTDPSSNRAVTFGGALADLLDANAARATQTIDPSQMTGNLIDRLA